MNTIGFFGDSFCAERINGHSLWHKYDSYMIKLEKHYNIKTVNTGVGGSGIWDLILNQFDPLVKANKVPDVCVFFWSKPGRLFHRQVRKLSIGHVLQPKWYSYNIFKTPVYNAARAYYTELYDHEKEMIEYKAVIEYFDTHVLSKVDTRIVHLWGADIGEYRFKHGVEIHPALTPLSLIGQDPSVMDRDQRCNHLDGDAKNQLVFEWIKDAIDDYQSGTLVDRSQEVDRLAT